MAPPRYLVSGDVSPRTAYRWLRSLPRTYGDVYIAVVWPEELGDDTTAALHSLDMPCKTLDDETPGKWAGRTRFWRGSQRRSDATLWVDGRGRDRELGMHYATLLSRLLRASHRDGTPLLVRGGG